MENSCFFTRTELVRFNQHRKDDNNKKIDAIAKSESMRGGVFFVKNEIC